MKAVIIWDGGSSKRPNILKVFLMLSLEIFQKFSIEDGIIASSLKGTKLERPTDKNLLKAVTKSGKHHI